jgi:hypothetical protein
MKVTLNIPETLPFQAFDLSLYVASKLYGDGLLSAGQGSQMTGLSKRAFIEIMGKYGVSAFSESLDDLTTTSTMREIAIFCNHMHTL